MKAHTKKSFVGIGGLIAVLLVALGLVLIPQARSQDQPKRDPDAPAAADDKAGEAKGKDTEARALFGEAVRKEHVEESIRMLENVVRKHPGDNWAGCALGYLGGIQWRRGKYDQAIKALQRVLSEYPEARYGNNKVVASISAYQLAMCYYAKGEKDKALKAYEEAVKKYPDAYPGDVDTGKRMAQSVRVWMEGEERKKGGTMAGTAAALKLFEDALREERAGNIEESMEMLADLAAQYPKDNWAGCALGQFGSLKMRQQKYDEAIMAYERVMREFPLARYGNGKLVASFAAYSIATCRYKKGEKERAMQAFDEAVKKYPNACSGDDDTGKRLADTFLEMIVREKR